MTQLVELHEAAHAVAALALGCDVHVVHANASDGTGYVQMSRGTATPEGLAIVYAAGAAFCLPLEGARSALEGFSEDERNAAKVLGYGNPLSASARTGLIVAAQSFLRPFASAVFAIADAIKSGGGFLSGDTTRALFRSASVHHAYLSGLFHPRATPAIAEALAVAINHARAGGSAVLLTDTERATMADAATANPSGIYIVVSAYLNLIPA